MGKSMSDTTAMPRSKNQALAWLVQNSPVTVASYRELGEVFGWERARTWKVIQAWRRKGYLETETAPDTGRLTVAIVPNVVPIAVDDGVDDEDGDGVSDTVREVSSPLPDAAEGRSPPPVAGRNGGNEPAVNTVYATYVPRPREDTAPRLKSMTALDVLTVLAALSLTACAATLSVRGMLVLFPGIPLGAMWLGGGIEACKLTAAAWIGHRWRNIGWTGRLSLGTLVVAAALLNMVGVYGQLVEGHVGARAQAAAGIETNDAAAAAKIEVASGRLADIDRRIAQIDGVVEGAAKRGKANTAVGALKGQKTDRAGLVQERERIAREVASLKADRAGAAAKGHAAEAEALPIQYVAQLFGVQAGGEEVVRWFIAGLVGCGDPFAIILLGVVMSRRRRAA
jgi:hypothetical protein